MGKLNITVTDKGCIPSFTPFWQFISVRPLLQSSLLTFKELKPKELKQLPHTLIQAPFSLEKSIPNSTAMNGL